MFKDPNFLKGLLIVFLLWFFGMFLGPMILEPIRSNATQGGSLPPVAENLFNLTLYGLHFAGSMSLFAAGVMICIGLIIGFTLHLYDIPTPLAIGAGVIVTFVGWSICAIIISVITKPTLLDHHPLTLLAGQLVSNIPIACGGLVAVIVAIFAAFWGLKNAAS